MQRPLYAYILTLLPNRSEAEDILQETNLILCRKAGEYNPEGHFQGWAFNIARYQVMGHISKFKRSKQFGKTIPLPRPEESLRKSIRIWLKKTTDGT